MSETVFKSVAPAPVVTDTPSPIKDPVATTESSVEVPFRDYETEHGHPYSVDYFKLGDTWAEHEGGFPHEIGLIEGYIHSEIARGAIADSTSAAQTVLKGLEKLTDTIKEERAVVKLGILANYIEFLNKSAATKRGLRARIIYE